MLASENNGTETLIRIGHYFHVEWRSFTLDYSEIFREYKSCANLVPGKAERDACRMSENDILLLISKYIRPYNR
jgi:hypothetical protein